MRQPLFSSDLADAGADTFVFDAKPVSNAERDRIADFAPGQDKIEIDASEFGGGLVAGAEVNLVASDRPTSAGQKGPTFLYDTDTGNLSYDDDGQGGHAEGAEGGNPHAPKKRNGSRPHWHRGKDKRREASA